MWALAADTAGALVTPETLRRTESLGLKVSEHFARSDAYGHFEPLGALVFTGPTHTNVSGFRALLVV